ncbi:class I SAM-dependent methyltransferase [uncultured Clostridium sp.]|uniref:class I SAM-dependent methyltransferase n=1 Tax=uncultured Clostridium sp. TaxID=59620 RepID=UPI0028E6A264|nr:class I SAM-dependent methyltransferase [uncultured Clostridium sp.]
MESKLKNQIEINEFDEKAKQWNSNIPKRNYDVAFDFIEKFNIEKNDTVLDVACGTGILFSILKDKNLSKYIAIDISENMVNEFLNIYPEVDVRQADFETIVSFENPFDYIIIYNSIPHFNNLDMVFKNAYNNLKIGGKFIIAHSKTRDGLKEHHKNIGYVSDKKEPIPEDVTLLELSNKYNFKNIKIDDSDYFCFSCERE